MVKNALVDPDLRFPIFFFSFPSFASLRALRGSKCLGRSQTNLTTDFMDPIWIKDRRLMPQIHPDPILSPSVVKNALVDPVLSFPIFSFPNFPLFRPCLVRFLCLSCFSWPCLGRSGSSFLQFLLSKVSSFPPLPRSFCALCAFGGGLKA